MARGPSFQAPPRNARASRPRHFELRKKGRAVDGALDAPVCTDLDGTRGDAGMTGGRYAEGGETPSASDQCVVGLFSL